MVMVVVVGAGLGIGLAREYANTYTLARQAVRLEQHRRDLIEQNTRLREEIQRLQTDDRYIERLARQQLGLVRPGEIELLIVPPDGASARGGPEPAVPSATPPAGPRSWSDRLHETMKRLFDWLRR